MKIIIPTDGQKGTEDKVAQHFGRCQTYTMLDEHGSVLSVINNTSEHMGGIGLPPELMKKQGANILLCKELGPRAVSLCYQLGIEVYLDLTSETVKEIFAKWKENKLKKAGLKDFCQDHQK